METRKKLLEEISEMPVADTHEHLEPESERLKGDTDFFTVTMSHYASSDLISAGMSAADMEFLRGGKNDFSEKINKFIPFWEKAKNTGYCRALELAAGGLYGHCEITASTLPEINAALKKANAPGLYRDVLETKSKIKFCVWDQWYHDIPPYDDFFKPALRLDDIVYINSKNDIEALEKKYGAGIETPEKMAELMDTQIERSKPGGTVALKTGLAYDRTLHYARVTRNEAASALERILKNRFTCKETKRLQDYMMYRVAEKAGERGLPLQIHTGLQEGNGNYISNSNPALLAELITDNPKTRFDLFHGGYPFGGELASLAKNFPNVWLDMCWLHIISPYYSERYLNEWLDAVPANKIFGFGGDFIFPEGTYGHLKIALENIARALGRRADDGVITEAGARRLARMILHDNAAEFFMN